MAEEVIEHTNESILGECESLLKDVEARLAAEAELSDQSPCVARLQRLRMTLIAIQSDPLDPEWAEAEAEAQDEKDREYDDRRRQMEARDAAWKAVARSEREWLVLAYLDGDTRLTVAEMATRFEEEFGIPAHYMERDLWRVMSRLHKRGLVNRAVVKRNVHCYFKPQPLAGVVAELERAFQADDDGCAGMA